MTESENLLPAEERALLGELHIKVRVIRCDACSRRDPGVLAESSCIYAGYVGYLLPNKYLMQHHGYEDQLWYLVEHPDFLDRGLVVHLLEVVRE